MSLLGIDIGTTGCKAIVFRVDGQVLGHAYREYPLIHPRDGCPSACSSSSASSASPD